MKELLDEANVALEEKLLVLVVSRGSLQLLVERPKLALESLGSFLRRFLLITSNQQRGKLGRVM